MTILCKDLSGSYFEIVQFHSNRRLAHFLSSELNKGNKMEKYTVLYNWGSFGVYGFICDADDIDHAEEQCQNAYPECNIFWVHKGNSIIDAENEWIGE